MCARNFVHAHICMRAHEWLCLIIKFVEIRCFKTQENLIARFYIKIVKLKKQMVCTASVRVSVSAFYSLYFEERRRPHANTRETTAASCLIHKFCLRNVLISIPPRRSHLVIRSLRVPLTAKALF